MKLPQPDTLQDVVKRLFPGEFPWRVTEERGADDTKFWLKPSLTRTFELTAEKLHLHLTSPHALVEWLSQRIRANQELICDQLDRSIGREPRIELVPHGKCKYCGAPYGT